METQGDQAESQGSLVAPRLKRSATGRRVANPTGADGKAPAGRTSNRLNRLLNAMLLFAERAHHPAELVLIPVAPACCNRHPTLKRS